MKPEDDPRQNNLGGSIVIRGEKTFTQYIVTDEDFLLIRDAGQSWWKDVLLATLPLAIATLLNAAAFSASRQGAFLFGSVESANYVVAIVAGTASVICGFAWWRNYHGLERILTAIKERPTRAVLRSQQVS
jgi:hypothetical protein